MVPFYKFHHIWSGFYLCISLRIGYIPAIIKPTAAAERRTAYSSAPAAITSVSTPYNCHRMDEETVPPPTSSLGRRIRAAVAVGTARHRQPGRLRPLPDHLGRDRPRLALK